MTLTFHKLKGATGATGPTGPQGPAGPAGSYTIASDSGLINTNNALSVNTGYTTSGKNYAVQKNSSGQLYVNVPWSEGTDTKNTAGATNSTSTIYLIGATTQGANPQTYSNSKIYATDGKLYSHELRLVASSPTSGTRSDVHIYA